MTDIYRKRDGDLDYHLSAAESAMASSLYEATLSYPVGSKVIVRTHSRKGLDHPPHERVGTVAFVRIGYFCLGDRHFVSPTVFVKNAKSGKIRPFYPSIEVHGEPQVRAGDGRS